MDENKRSGFREWMQKNARRGNSSVLYSSKLQAHKERAANAATVTRNVQSPTDVRISFQSPSPTKSDFDEYDEDRRLREKARDMRVQARLESSPKFQNNYFEGAHSNRPNHAQSPALHHLKSPFSNNGSPDLPFYTPMKGANTSEEFVTPQTSKKSPVDTLITAADPSTDNTTPVNKSRGYYTSFEDRRMFQEALDRRMKKNFEKMLSASDEKRSSDNNVLHEVRENHVDDNKNDQIDDVYDDNSIFDDLKENNLAPTATRNISFTHDNNGSLLRDDVESHIFSPLDHSLVQQNVNDSFVNPIPQPTSHMEIFAAARSTVTVNHHKKNSVVQEDISYVEALSTSMHMHLEYAEKADGLEKHVDDLMDEEKRREDSMKKLKQEKEDRAERIRYSKNLLSALEMVMKLKELIATRNRTHLETINAEKEQRIAHIKHLVNTADINRLEREFNDLMAESNELLEKANNLAKMQQKRKDMLRRKAVRVEPSQLTTSSDEPKRQKHQNNIGQPNFAEATRSDAATQVTGRLAARGQNFPAIPVDKDILNASMSAVNGIKQNIAEEGVLRPQEVVSSAESFTSTTPRRIGVEPLDLSQLDVNKVGEVLLAEADMSARIFSASMSVSGRLNESRASVFDDSFRIDSGRLSTGNTSLRRFDVVYPKRPPSAEPNDSKNQSGRHSLDAASARRLNESLSAYFDEDEHEKKDVATSGRMTPLEKLDENAEIVGESLVTSPEDVNETKFEGIHEEVGDVFGSSDELDEEEEKSKTGNNANLEVEGDVAEESYEERVDTEIDTSVAKPEEESIDDVKSEEAEPTNEVEEKKAEVTEEVEKKVVGEVSVEEKSAVDLDTVADKEASPTAEQQESEEPTTDRSLIEETTLPGPLSDDDLDVTDDSFFLLPTQAQKSIRAEKKAASRKASGESSTVLPKIVEQEPQVEEVPKTSLAVEEVPAWGRDTPIVHDFDEESGANATSMIDEDAEAADMEAFLCSEDFICSTAINFARRIWKEREVLRGKDAFDARLVVPMPNLEDLLSSCGDAAGEVFNWTLFRMFSTMLDVLNTKFLKYVELSDEKFEEKFLAEAKKVLLDTFLPKFEWQDEVKAPQPIENLGLLTLDSRYEVRKNMPEEEKLDFKVQKMMMQATWQMLDPAKLEEQVDEAREIVMEKLADDVLKAQISELKTSGENLGAIEQV